MDKKESETSTGLDSITTCYYDSQCSAVEAIFPHLTEHLFVSKTTLWLRLCADSPPLMNDKKNYNVTKKYISELQLFSPSTVTQRICIDLKYTYRI